MEDVCLAVLPVREALLVRASQLHGSLSEIGVIILSFCALALLSIMYLSHGGLELHFVRVNDLGLLFHVERLLMAFRVGILPRELLLVVACGHGGVRVPHEPVVASSALAIQVVADRHLFEGISGPQRIAS